MRISDWSSDMCSSDLELGRNPDPDRSAAILRGLPAFFDLDPSSVQGKPGRALVVTRARTLGHMLARELATCGYRAQQTGRASCRERVSPYVEISEVAVSFKHKTSYYNIFSTQTYIHPILII